MSRFIDRIRLDVFEKEGFSIDDMRWFCGINANSGKAYDYPLHCIIANYGASFIRAMPRLYNSIGKTQYKRMLKRYERMLRNEFPGEREYHLIMEATIEYEYLNSKVRQVKADGKRTRVAYCKLDREPVY